MRDADQGAVARQIQRVFQVGTVSGLSEDELLHRVHARRDAPSFEALLGRHGPMVWGVCRRLLHDTNDVEDAFQATFLILLGKAGSLRDPSGVGPWLHGVAYRVALRARGDTARRREKEHRAAHPEATAGEVDDDRERLLALDEEIRRLPEKYARPVILCELEGLTYEDAARRLNGTPAAIKGRLSRARKRLRDRLSRRGLAPNAGLVGPSSLSIPAPATPPETLTISTIGLLKTTSLGDPIAKTSVMAIVNGVLGAMRTSRLKFMAMSLTVMAGTTLIALACVFGQQGGPDQQEPGAGTPRESARPIATEESDPRDRDQEASPGRTMKIRVVDKRTRGAVPAVALRVASDNLLKEVVTDASGQYLLTLPEAHPNGLWIRARKEGFVPTWVTWGGGHDSPRLSLPGSFEIELEPGTSIGGQVQDPRGQPIEGVLVELSIPSGFMADGISLPSLSAEPIKTDAKGHWVCNFAPANLEGLSFRLQHPDHVSDQIISRKLTRVSALRDTTAVMVMDSGVPLTGRVTDREARPIAGAKVTQGTESSPGPPFVKTTDADGRFSFPHVEPGDTLLVVRAPGYAPDLARVRARAAMPPVDIRLEPGRTIEGRVLDLEGKPLANTSVGAVGFPEFPSLGSRTKSTAEGGFRLTDQPTRPVTLRVYKPGFMFVERPSRATDGESRITLTPEFTVRGSVVDAETGQPIPDFKLLIGDDSTDESERWNRELAYKCQGGHYEVVFTTSRPELRSLRIEAAGYFPAVSRGFRTTESPQVYDFQLKRGTPANDPALSGIVRLPDGSPAVGAIVTLATNSQRVSLKDGRDMDPERHPTVTTGSDGRFAFPHQDEPAVLLAYHERGQARILEEDFAKSHVMTIQPWGRVEGTLKVGTSPRAFQVVVLFQGRTSGREDRRVDYQAASTESDSSGRFFFEHVIPGDIRVGRASSASSWITSGPWLSLEVAPGAAVHVTVGGSGRPVVGRFVAKPDAIPNLDWSSLRFTLTPQIKFPRVNVPEGLTGEKRAEWIKAWRQSEAGIAYMRRSDRESSGYYQIKVEADGSFRIEDVIAGAYQWIIIPTSPSSEHRRFWSVTPGTTTIPEIPGGRGDTPLELGELTLAPSEQPAR
ncbi:sigma-70 family RNA polymerase sigma factor [Singulisphaera rosea]